MERTWIQPESLDAVLAYLSLLVKHELTPDDLQAVSVGLDSTNDETDDWFCYPLYGESTVELALARDAESPSVLHVRVTAPPALEREVRTTLSIASCFVLRHPTGQAI